MTVGVQQPARQIELIIGNDAVNSRGLRLATLRLITVEFATRRDTTNDADAEKFMQRFGGEWCDPKQRGKGPIMKEAAN
jgi:hypothetical protein